MKYEEGYRSDDVEDRRGNPSKRGAKLGIGGTIVGVIVMLVFGQDLLGVSDGNRAGAPDGDGDTSEEKSPAAPPTDEKLLSFVHYAFDDIQKTWIDVFPASGLPAYQKAKLVLFVDGTDTKCGYQGSATGPFYCPPDLAAYIDLGFYKELRDSLGAKGDFAQAYVLAHEIGHHIQKITGINDRVHRESNRNPGQKNHLSVLQELQADCYAGLWAKAADGRGLLEAGDIDEALKAAWAIGDDRLQRMAGRSVSPETWTHGSSEQRMRWFRRGYERGTMAACDTFSAGE